MSLLRKTVHSTVLVVVFAAIASMFGYLFRFILARNLSVAEYGLFFAILSLFSFLAVIVNMGLPHAAPKFVINYLINNDLRKAKTVLKYAFIFNFSISVIFFLIVFLFKDIISTNYLGIDDTSLLMLMAFWFVINIFLSLPNNIFTGFQKPVINSTVDLTRSVILLFSTIFFFYLNFEVKSPALAYLTTTVVLMIIYLPLSISFFPNFFSIRAKKSRKIFNKLLKFGFYMSLAAFAWIVITQVDTILITAFLSLEEVGLYQVAVPLASLLLYFISAVNVVVYPTIASLFLRKKHHELSIGIALFYKYIYLVLMPFAILFFSFSTQIIKLFFGEEYVGASIALKILVLGGLFSSLVTFNNSALAAVGSPKNVSTTMILLMVLNLILNLTLIPLLGISGAALATTITFFVGLFISLHFLKMRITFNIPITKWLLTFISGIISIALVHLFIYIFPLPYLTAILISLLLASSSYIICISSLRIANLSEVKKLIKELT